MTHYVLGFGFSPTEDHGLGPVVSCLMHHKGSGPMHAQGLNVFGGKVESVESPREAVSREYKEETGILVGKSRWKHFYRGGHREGDILLDCFVVELTREEVLSMSLRNDKQEKNVEVSFHARQGMFNTLTPVTPRPHPSLVASSISFLLPMAYHFLHNPD